MPDNQQNSKVATDLRLFVSALRSQQPTFPRVIDAEVWATLPSPCTLLWIENSSVTDGWQLSDEHIITGVPHNEWQLTLQRGQCVEVLPVGEEQWVVKPYHIGDPVTTDRYDADTPFIGQPLAEWTILRGLDYEDKGIVSGRLYPLVDSLSDVQLVLRWMLNEPDQQGGRMVWDYSERLTAAQAADRTNHKRLFDQRKDFITDNWPFLKNR